ncbi:hypothetical protein BGW39_003620, partial [Mortierella sp. 14UC]
PAHITGLAQSMFMGRSQTDRTANLIDLNVAAVANTAATIVTIDSARCKPVYGPENAAMENYTHINNPAVVVTEV